MHRAAKKADIFRFEYWLGNICCDDNDDVDGSMMRKVKAEHSIDADTT
jgi:hypothetical protein